MKSADARRIVADLGLTERVQADVDAMPALTADEIATIRRIFTRIKNSTPNAPEAGPITADPRTDHTRADGRDHGRP